MKQVQEIIMPTHGNRVFSSPDMPYLAFEEAIRHCVNEYSDEQSRISWPLTDKTGTPVVFGFYDTGYKYMTASCLPLPIGMDHIDYLFMFAGLHKGEPPDKCVLVSTDGAMTEVLASTDEWFNLCRCLSILGVPFMLNMGSNNVRFWVMGKSLNKLKKILAEFNCPVFTRKVTFREIGLINF